LKDTNLWLDEELSELVDRQIEECLCVLYSVEDSGKEIGDVSIKTKETKSTNFF
jgi:hypothetical protein